jgi:lipoprotein signal peptidase
MHREIRIGRRIVLFAAAVVLAEHLFLAADVPGDSWQQHARSPAWAIVALAAIALMLILREVSAGCWLLIAGAAGNLIGWVQAGSVPDYLTVVVGDRWVAFNLADAAILTGATMVIATLATRAQSERRARERA